ncbi:MAG: hypothetical protein HY695_22930 [Deltaproteobacteria bacterium]|nr:hypothetical protein [Deltaproteobacteria bacterium]
MCEYCNQTSVTVERMDPDEESVCEWISDDGLESCDRPAVYSVLEWYVEDHLCDTHLEQVKRHLDEGLAEFLESVGFGSQYELHSIHQEESCDYISPASAQSWQPCGKRAGHAKYTLENLCLCAEHFAEMGYDSSAPAKS